MAQGLAAPEAHRQCMGEQQWAWTMLQSSEPDAGGCDLGTSCPTTGAPCACSSSPAAAASAGSWHQPSEPHIATHIRPQLSS